MMKIFCVIVFIIGGFSLYAQSVSQKCKHILYFEGLGLGGYGSINYESVFFEGQKSKISISGRVGIGTNNFVDFRNRFNPDLMFPVGVYAFYGKNHHVEIGVSHILSVVVQYAPHSENYRAVNSHMSFSVGYRYQKYPKGIFGGVRYSPIIEFYKHFRHWTGAYIGYCF